MAEQRTLEKDFSQRILEAAGLYPDPAPERMVVLCGRGRPPVVFVEQDRAGLWLRYDWPDGLAGREVVSVSPLVDVIRMVL